MQLFCFATFLLCFLLRFVFRSSLDSGVSVQKLVSVMLVLSTPCTAGFQRRCHPLAAQAGAYT